MMQLAHWLSAETLRLLAVALLHFLWQGAALAALAYMVMGVCRSAATRYVAGVGTLVLMLVAPIGSFLFLRAQNREQAPIIVAGDTRIAETPVNVPAFTTAKHPSARQESAPYLLWLVELWFAGVVLLSLRSAGGFLVVARLRRRESSGVGEELLELCLSLQQRMGLTRVVRYCESLRLDGPAVAGWIRPVVLLPVTAITGLSEEQLEAVIAHELAHIQRHDAFVNLFQVSVETLLFYHPAVWWLGKRIRTERENCCDDVAVALCGSAVTYAHALTSMAEWKAAPQLVMAGNRGALVERIARLLAANGSRESFRGANASAGVLCLVAALLAGSAFVGNAYHVHAQAPAPAPEMRPANQSAAPAAGRPRASRVPDSTFVVRPSDRESDLAPAPAPAPVAAPELIPAPVAIPGSPAIAPSAIQGSQASPSTPKQSYIDSMKDAGLTNLSVDELIGLKVQGVTPEYVRAMKDLGIKPDADELTSLKVQGITPVYVKEMRAATGQSLDADALIGLKVQGLTPEYIREIHDLGLKTEADEIVGMKVQGITPDYVKSMQAAGLHPDADELIGMKVQGVTADYIKALQSAGFKVAVDEVIGAKVQGVTPEFIDKVRSHGFKDLTLDKIIQLKNAGVFDAEK